MDIQGAKELARRLEKRLGKLPEPKPVTKVGTGAAPVFRYLGIEPPVNAAWTDE